MRKFSTPSFAWLATYVIVCVPPAFAGRSCADGLESTEPSAGESIVYDDARALFGAYGWLDVKSARHGRDGTGHRVYVFVSRRGGREVYRETAGETVDASANVEPNVTARNVRLVKVDRRGRVDEHSVLRVRVEERSSPGRVIETWTFTKAGREVILTFCNRDEERSAYPPHPSSSP